LNFTLSAFLGLLIFEQLFTSYENFPEWRRVHLLAGLDFCNQIINRLI